MQVKSILRAKDVDGKLSSDKASAAQFLSSLVSTIAGDVPLMRCNDVIVEASTRCIADFAAWVSPQVGAPPCM